MTQAWKKRNRWRRRVLIVTLAVSAMFFFRRIIITEQRTAPRLVLPKRTTAFSTLPTDPPLVREQPALIPRHYLFSPRGTQNKSMVVATPVPSAAPMPVPVIAHSMSADDSALELPHVPLTDNIAVVGIVQVNGVWKALVENCESGETRFVCEGESAFEYRVKSVFQDGVILERSSKEFVLALDETKGSSPISEVRFSEASDLTYDLPDQPIPEDVQEFIGDLQVVWRGDGFKTEWVDLR